MESLQPVREGSLVVSNACLSEPTYRGIVHGIVGKNVSVWWDDGADLLYSLDDIEIKLQRSYWTVEVW